MKNYIARRLLPLGILVIVVACDHTESFNLPTREPLGPFPPDPGNSFVTRLTFNTGDDRNPSVHGSTLVFSRFDAVRFDRDRCIAFMPVEGGRIFRMECPNGGRPDLVVNAWLNPAISPDGARISFVAEESNARLLQNQPAKRQLFVAPIDSLDRAIAFNPSAIRVTRGGINDFREVVWVDSTTVRFIGGTGGFNALGRDTIFSPLGLFDWEVNSGSVTLVSGILNPIAHTIAPDGGIWFIRAADSSTIHHVPLGAVTSVPVPFDWSGVSDVPGVMWDIDNLDGLPLVAVRTEVKGGDTPPFDANIVENHVFLLHPGTAVADLVWVGATPRSVVAIPGQQAVVAEIQQTTGANLFMLLKR